MPIIRNKYWCGFCIPAKYIGKLSAQIDYFIKDAEYIYICSGVEPKLKRSAAADCRKKLLKSSIKIKTFFWQTNFRHEFTDFKKLPPWCLWHLKNLVQHTISATRYFYSHYWKFFSVTLFRKLNLVFWWLCDSKNCHTTPPVISWILFRKPAMTCTLK